MKLGIDWPEWSKDLLRKEVRRNRVRRSRRKWSVIEKFVVYEERFPERFTGFQDSPVPAHCSIEISTKYKMVKINVESFSEEELMKKWSELGRKESWDEKCEMCKMPEILHKDIHKLHRIILALSLLHLSWSWITMNITFNIYLIQIQ